MHKASHDKENILIQIYHSFLQINQTCNRHKKHVVNHQQEGVLTLEHKKHVVKHQQ